ncbi:MULTISPECIES: PAS domain-containing protein [Lichenihabitans]|uniref:PAS domain-containing protein n=1 Tax=Lichenihabitans TaxID=2723776 RepID=UPI001036E40A|nr:MULTISPECIES: PAS domain-containing protein [Lichenihabitans]UDL94708.1 PAS domain-containing protein [Lichenihabitans sp. PAMC28606]
MIHAVSQELYAYWNTLRGGRTAPERGEIDPAAIRGILSDTFILEVDTPTGTPIFPIRLSGTRMNALFLDELKGRSWLSLWDRFDRSTMLSVLFGVLDDGSPAVAGLAAGPEDQSQIELEMLLLPLRHNGRAHARLLGCIAPLTIPSWLGLSPVNYLSLRSLRLLEIERAAFTLDQLEPAPPKPVVRNEPPKRYGYLVLHQGGRAAGGDRRAG